MGTRNIRILRSQVALRLAEIDGRHAHLVLMNGKTFSGLVVSVGQGQISIQDTNARWTSLCRHTHRIPLEEIMEVVLDTVTEY